MYHSSSLFTYYTAWLMGNQPEKEKIPGRWGKQIFEKLKDTP